jgi:hypothetical protein
METVPTASDQRRTFCTESRRICSTVLGVTIPNTRQLAEESQRLRALSEALATTMSQSALELEALHDASAAKACELECDQAERAAIVVDFNARVADGEKITSRRLTSIADPVSPAAPTGSEAGRD